MAVLTPLSKWIIEQPEQIVAVQMGEENTHIELVQRVSSWVNALSTKSGKRWAVYHADAFEFLAILLALWQLEKLACIPGDNTAGTVKQLSQHVDGFIGDFPEGLAITEANLGTKPVSWRALNSQSIALEIYTSGSTGEPKAISKTFFQLEKELESIEAHWPTQHGAVLATVSHQHFYGMIFRLLWPFSARVPFARLSSEYSEDIFHHAQYYPAFSVVSSPSHLSRVNTAVDWKQLRGQCQYLISSAAPLERKDSVFINNLLDAPVREIYGSSETGAIAWRVQHDRGDKTKWHALPKVELTASSNGVLSVSASYIGQEEALILSDCALFDELGGFELIGRVDSIVKIEGKRVSLTSMDTMLLDNSWVKEAKALVLNRNRVEIAIVMKLSEAGERQLMMLGRRSFIKQFKEALSQYFEPSVLPRRWRFVESMPYNTQGKLPLKELRELFDQKPIIKWPKFKKITTTNVSAAIHGYIPAELIYFDGHFNNTPILPGVTQVYWVEKLGCHLFSIDACFKSLEVIKFQQIIGPEMDIIINLEYNESKKKLLFSYESEKGTHASGRICFE